MRKRKRAGLGVFTLSFCLAAACYVQAAENGTWALTDDGKHWQYLYAPDDPAEDVWIEDHGKEYYLDTKGYMKTGWVTDKNSGNKYYMGEDGAKCYNLITPDDHFVGEEGVILKRYDTYRKKVKTVLKKELKEQKKQQKEQSYGFVLMDLNWDGYLDLVVADQAEAPEQILLAAVWDPEEEDFTVVTESDVQTEKSRLWTEEASRRTWLLLEENEWNLDYFLLEEEETYFESQWQLRTLVNDWEELEYYVNGQQTSQEEWHQRRQEAKIEAETGAQQCLVWVPLTEEKIDAMTDRVLTLEEQELWQNE